MDTTCCCATTGTGFCPRHNIDAERAAKVAADVREATAACFFWNVTEAQDGEFVIDTGGQKFTVTVVANA